MCGAHVLGAFVELKSAQRLRITLVGFILGPRGGLEVSMHGEIDLGSRSDLGVSLRSGLDLGPGSGLEACGVSLI